MSAHSGAARTWVGADGKARILESSAVRAVGRFSPEGVQGYRAVEMPNAPLRATREEAESDARVWRERNT